MPDQFTRREVGLDLLAGALALAEGGHGPRPVPAPRLLFDFAIAGGWYSGLRFVVGELEPGEVLVLRRQPSNPADADAVEVLRQDGMKLGYVPRVANAPVARLLARGVAVEAIVVETLWARTAAGIPDDLVYTGFSDGDPRIRLTARG